MSFGFIVGYLSPHVIDIAREHTFLKEDTHFEFGTKKILIFSAHKIHLK